MKSKAIFFLAAFFLLGNVVFAYPTMSRYFISLGLGVSVSTKADIKVDDNFWDPAPQGYDDDLGISEVYTASLGYHLTHLWSFEFEVSYRPEFKYSRFQTSTASGTPGFLGEKVRKFKLSNWSYLFNVYLNKLGECFSFEYFRGYRVAPILGAGIGIGYNTVSDFHSVLPVSSTTGFSPIASIMQSRTETAFAAQAIIGLISRISERLSVELGYRRFHAGKFLSNNYLVDVPTGGIATQPNSSPPWKGFLNANEVFLTVCLAI